MKGRFTLDSDKHGRHVINSSHRLIVAGLMRKVGLCILDLISPLFVTISIIVVVFMFCFCRITSFPFYGLFFLHVYTFIYYPITGPDGAVPMAGRYWVLGTGFNPERVFKSPMSITGLCAHNRRVLQQLALNVHVKHWSARIVQELQLEGFLWILEWSLTMTIVK